MNTLGQGSPQFSHSKDNAALSERDPAFADSNARNGNDKLKLSLPRRALLTGVIAATVTLGGCYVVPIQAPVSTSPTPSPMQLPTPVPLTFSARLYPSNDLAASYGMLGAVVTNDLNGRGTFTTNINGENFSGEATRVSGSSREGIANGAGNRGSYISCRYQMNTATLGSGSCKLSNGATFNMHVGQ